MSVHSWPKSQLVRLARNSSSSDSFQVAKCTLLHRYGKFGLDSASIQELFAYDPYYELRLGTCCVTAQLGSPAVKSEKPGRPLMLVLDFHPSLQFSGVERVVRNILTKYSYMFPTLIGTELHSRVAWRNSGLSLFQLTRNSYRDQRTSRVTVQS